MNPKIAPDHLGRAAVVATGRRTRACERLRSAPTCVGPCGWRRPKDNEDGKRVGALPIFRLLLPSGDRRGQHRHPPQRQPRHPRQPPHPRQPRQPQHPRHPRQPPQRQPRQPASWTFPSRVVDASSLSNR